MASWCVRRYLLKHTLSSKVALPVLQTVRGSIYSPKYLDPTVSKEELSQPLKDDDPRKFQPIKAARTEETTLFFHDPLLQKFTNMMMQKGKKTLAKDIIEKAFENIKRIQIENYHKAADEVKQDIELDPLKIFHQAVDNCKPILVLTKIQKGGVRYEVPIPCGDSNQRFRAMKWIIESCRDKERTVHMENKLAWELLDAYKNEGRSVKRKQDLLRMCEANKAYAHYRW
ncbi:hypothetical protein ScPMuIL_004368 [Solemya velum]